MKPPKKYFNTQSRFTSFLEFKLFMSGQNLDSYINNLNPLFPDYINLELLKYLLSIGSNVACRIYFNNNFCDCIIIASDIGYDFSSIIKVERTSFFKIIQRCRNIKSENLTFYIRLQC